MSPDRTTITRAEAIRRRKEEQARRVEEAIQKQGSSLLGQISTVVKNTALKPGTPPAKPTTPAEKPASYGNTPGARRRVADANDPYAGNNYANTPYGNNANQGSSTQNNGYAQYNATTANPAQWQDPASQAAPSQTARVRRVVGGGAARPRVAQTGRAQQSAFSLPHIQLPKVDFTSRWVALSIAAISILACYLLLYTPLFAVQQINVNGAVNVNAGELISGLGAMEQQLITLDWAQTRLNILASYPEVAEAKLEWGFPNVLNVNITERIPVAEWRQDGNAVWVDEAGYAFPVRNPALGVTAVQANGPAPTPTLTEEQASEVGAKPYLMPELVRAIKVVSGTVPQGTILMYDPAYGLGWTDPQGGWQVYYGSTEGNNEEKMAVYNALVADLAAKNIVPTLINVEYPNAPFYQTAGEPVQEGE